MPIPSDPLCREWLEIGSENPGIVDQFRPILFGILAFGKDAEPQFAGTGFAIANGEGVTLALTAKHVIVAGVNRIQQPHPRHASSALFLPPGIHKPSLDRRKIKATWMDSSDSKMLDIWHVGYNDTLDVACLLIEGASRANRMAVPLDTRTPTVGDEVQVVSLSGLQVSELESPIDRSGIGQVIRVHRRTSVRIGTVTAVCPEGLRQYKWPCFTTSVPAEPGMSGGLVSVITDGGIVSACGIICADNSEPDAFSNFSKQGESIVSSLWPALSLETASEFSAEEYPKSIYELMRSGAMPLAAGGIDGFEVVKLDDGDYRITRK